MRPPVVRRRKPPSIRCLPPAAVTVAVLLVLSAGCARSGSGPHSIAVRVFVDSDGDGAPSPDEIPIAGVAVSLSGRQAADTDAAGTVEFSGLARGEYRIGLSEES
ncbi:MAG: hypothetical protein JSW65_00265, partial [Candidatus Bipolaricaulota bacterium]